MLKLIWRPFYKKVAELEDLRVSLCRYVNHSFFFCQYIRTHGCAIRYCANPDHDIVVASFGGVMTEALFKWAERHKSAFYSHAHLPLLSVNRNLRLVYIFGDPIESVLSLFRRNSQREGVYTYIAGDYSRYADIATMLKMRNLKSYLASDTGAFPIREHLHNWQTAPTQLPILFIRYETIWDNLDVLQSFLDLPKEAMATFPKKKERASSYKALGLNLKEQEKLNQLYGDFREEIKQMPDTHIRAADWFVPDPAEDTRRG